MVGGGWMVTASQCPTKVYLALQLPRKVQRIMICQIYTLSLSCAMMTVHCKKEGVKSKMKIYVPALIYN